MAEILKTWTTDNLNMRPTPGLSRPATKMIPVNSEIEYIPITPLSANGYSWVPVYYYGWGWCAINWLAAFQKPTVIRKSWAGAHTIGSTSDALRTMILNCKTAGKPLASLLSVIDASIFQWTKQVSPETITINRPLWPDNYPTEGGRIKFNQGWFDSNIAPTQAYLPFIDYIQFVNEKWPGNDASGQILQDIANFYIDLMNACNKIGKHCTVLDLAPGNMADDRHAPEPDQFSVMKPMLQKASAEGHVLNYHMYNDLENGLDPASRKYAFAMRWVKWVKEIPGLKMLGGEALVGEWGGSVLPSDSNQVVGMMNTIDGMIEYEISQGNIKREQMIGYNGFTGNPGDRWKNFNMEPHYPAQTKYLVTK